LLKVKRLVLNDFGPFKGEQTIQFPDENGVVIIYGENMEGKTSLLNALRYALFGKVLGRGAYPVPLHQICNWESTKDGRFGFKVALAFESDGHQYELTRALVLKKKIIKPDCDEDYEQECYLRKDGDVLSTDQRDLELSQVMPEQVSRFFLFDGELLEEYEELLRDQSTMGPAISGAIERILGVPILVNARAECGAQLKEARKQEAKAAAKVESTKAIGLALGELDEKHKHHDEEINRLSETLDNLKDDRQKKETILSKNAYINARFDERRKLREDIAKLEKDRAIQEGRLKELMKDAWRGMLDSKVKELRSSLMKEEEDIQARVRQKLAESEAIKSRNEAVCKGKCPICTQPLSKELADSLKRPSPVEGSVSITENNRELQRLHHVLDRLGDFMPKDISTDLINIRNSLDNFKVDKSTMEDRIQEITNEVGTDSDTEESIRQAISDFARIVKQIASIEGGISRENEELAKIDKNMQELRENLSKIGGASTARERTKRELCDNLSTLFSDGVSVYRENLRQKVEHDSSVLFLKLTKGMAYAGLQINDNYGLTIIHNDGQEIPLRSASAEQIVALSLMGALQKNAPLRGPIIMDSPFIRMDISHKTNVLTALPHMADQVVLLVFGEELKPQMAREVLLGKLRSEFKMVKHTDRYTTIEKSLEAN